MADAQYVYNSKRPITKTLLFQHKILHLTQILKHNKQLRKERH
jgi:hypothetical protein